MPQPVTKIGASTIAASLLYGVLALLFLGVLAFGAVEYWSVFALRTGAALLLLWWLAGQWLEGRLALHGSPLFAPAALFGAVVAAGLLGFSSYRQATITEALMYTAYAVILFLGAQCIRTEADNRHVVLAFVVFGFLVATFAILQGLSRTEDLYWLRRPRTSGSMFGPYVNHNHYAGMMELVAPFAVVLAASDRLAGARRMLVAFAAVIMSASIFLSGSRGGMLSFALQLIFLTAVLLPASRGRTGRLSYAAGLIVLIAMVAWIGGGRVMREVEAISDVSTERIRLAIAQDSLRMFAQKPVMGWGLGTFPIVYPGQRSFSLDVNVNQAHNDYAQLLVETGVVGFAAMLWFLFALFRAVLQKLDDPLRSWGGMATVAASASCIGILVHSLFDFNLHIPANAALFFFCCAVAAATQARRDVRPVSLAVH